MIDDILKKVQENIGEQLIEKSGISEDKISSSLQSISGSVFKKTKELMDSGQLMQLKDVFLGGNQEEKASFMNEMKENISSNLQAEQSITQEQANSFIDISIPELFEVSKKELLGPDGKFSFTDLPKIMSFFKSEGKEVKSGGLGGLFNFG